MSKKVAVLVAGSWGTALASVLASNELDVVMWTRSEEQAAEINTQHTNTRYLPGAELSPAFGQPVIWKQRLLMQRRC